MVFFVLSGYFVGGSVISGLRKGGFSCGRYGQARLTRLWMVLLPALLLTLGIDVLGSMWNPGAYAGGLSERFMSGPTIMQPAAHDLWTFLGNLSFLQTVTVPVYGSNGPLWSLANEFWYYLMFPLLAVACARIVEGRQQWLVVLQVLLVGLIAWWLPRSLVLGGLIWLMGVAVWWVVRWKAENGKPKAENGRLKIWIWRALGGGLFFGSLLASKTGHWLGSDHAVGAVFAVWMISLIGPWQKSSLYSRLATGLSEISYTLYVVHFPLLFFAAAVLLKGHQFPPNTEGFVWYVGLSVLIVIISVAMWWLFERNTTWVRKRLWRRP